MTENMSVATSCTDFLFSIYSYFCCVFYLCLYDVLQMYFITNTVRPVAKKMFLADLLSQFFFLFVFLQIQYFF